MEIDSDAEQLAAPPVAKKIPTTRNFHGDQTIDEYAWLHDSEDPDVEAYLEAENDYTQAAMAHTKPLQDEIFGEIKSRVLETDLSVPSFHGGWWYYTRTVEGSQYPIHCRSNTEPKLPVDPSQPLESPTDEVILIDQNELAGESPYFALGAFDISPNGNLLAYSTDYDGSEKYTMRFKDLVSGEVLPDEIPGTYYSTAWSADGSTFFYTTVDDAMRPYRVWRHQMGTAADADAIVHQEDDERFFAGVGLTRSEQIIVIEMHSKVTSEAWVLDASDPLGSFSLVEPRLQGVEYSIDHSGEYFYIVHNYSAVNFEVARVSVDSPSRDQWEVVVPGSDDMRIDGVDVFARHLVMSYRANGSTALRVIRLDDDSTAEIEFDEEVRTVGAAGNPQFDTDQFRFVYTSLTTPGSVYDYDVTTGERELRKQQPVLGDFDPSLYESTREWATTDDGTHVPISIVKRKDVPVDGSAPCLLYGYGSYEICMDPTFSVARLSLLDRGFVFAIAHIRGGGEMGRSWYEDGKLLAKKNTFTDFVASAKHMVSARWTSADRLVGRGGSAGGLLIGAVANLAPDAFGALVAEVPFVDALNTILDPSQPLTVIEWEEWGNPIESAEVYAYMKAYSPYENVGPSADGSAIAAYPPILATAGLNDPRVGYHEPAKWVAKLRASSSRTDQLLLKTEMGAGHSGPSGRYDAWRDEAFTLAFVLDVVGVG